LHFFFFGLDSLAMDQQNTNELIQTMRKGDRRSLARLLSLVEAQDENSFKVLREISNYAGNSQSIGITGPAGAGKSTTIDQLIRRFREQEKKVGVLAVDPSSPFTGGAVLGDRVRMQRHSADSDVYIRSIGSRGKTGGVSFSTRALMQMIDAYGADYILVETVGAGQSEVDIMNLVDTTVVILTPESGDSIQALKAGMLEIANIFVINKKDRDGAERIANDIKMMLSLNPYQEGWVPPIIMTEAQSGEGVDELVTAIKAHQEDLKQRGRSVEDLRRRRTYMLHEILQTRVMGQIRQYAESKNDIQAALKDPAKEPNYYALAEDCLSEILQSKAR
jgi:LAO/AO transport system kinase